MVSRLVSWKANEKFFSDILPLARPRLNTFADFFPLAQFLFNESPHYSTEDLVGKLEPSQVCRLFKIAEWELEKANKWDRDSISAIFQRIGEVEKRKLKDLLRPFFFALSGSSVSLPLFDGMALLGPDLCRVRIRKALNQLNEAGAALSKKGLKTLEKEYRKDYGKRID